MRLIDADALIENLKNMCCADNSIQRRKIVDSTLHELMPQVIDDEPTIEVEPVKHGTWAAKKPSRMKWIPDENDDITEEETTIEDMIEQKCSICQRWSIKFAYHIEMNFCPKCGARMDGDNDD